MLSDHVVFGDGPRTSFPLLLEHVLVDSRENIRFLTLKRFANCFQMLFPLLFVLRHSPD